MCSLCAAINTVTRLYMSGTIRSWLHYIDLRGDNGTQREHMSIAQLCSTKFLIHRASYYMLAQCGVNDYD